MLNMAKTGVPVFHSCGFQFGSGNVIVPVIHCCMYNKLLKAMAENTNPFITSHVFVGQDLVRALLIQSLFHMVLTKVTWFYLVDRWVTMGDPRWLDSHLNYKCGLSWDCQLEYMVSPMSGFQESRWNLPVLLKASPRTAITVLRPFFVGQASY